jgi:alginate O-acetyltransferase complex protein AlgJ
MFATVQSQSGTDPDVLAWCLDTPKAGQRVAVEGQAVRVSGWVLTRQPLPAPASVVCRADTSVAEEFMLPVQQERPDVILRMLAGAPDGHPQLHCGFDGWVPLTGRQITLALRLRNRLVPLGRATLSDLPPPTTEDPHQVLRGDGGWLFLDNDSNHSVDQHTGRRLLGLEELQGWWRYFAGCRRFAARLGVRHAFVLAVSKEEVLPEFHPYPRGRRTVADQVREVCDPEDHLVDAAALLSGLADRPACFMKTDTHWTDRGARWVVLALVEALGLSPARAAERFADDVYYRLPFAGDLGGKLSPAEAADTEFLLAPPLTVMAASDNAVVNTGRLMVFLEREPVWPGKLLLFGSSSSYSMLSYLRRLFAWVIFVHSAGSVDPALASRERPDYLVTQTTGRFAIIPPRLDFNQAAAAQAAGSGSVSGGS